MNSCSSKTLIMSKKLIILLAAAACITSFSACYKDIISPGQDPNGPPQQVSFSGDIVPLLSTNCALAGCHDATPAHKPSMTAENAYNAILSGGYVNTVVPLSSTIYSEVKSGSMPPAGALKASDTQKILDWIRNGAPNN
jgi:hypothetical protein